jgi:LPS-assembly lipoprotein
MKRLGLTGLTLALAALLAGCGFHPLYGSVGGNPGAQQIFSSIYVDTIDGDNGYELRNALIDVLDASNKPDSPRYSLKLTLKDQLQGSALEPNTAITRYNYTLTADYVLLDAASGNALTRGEVSSLNAYNVVASPYATLVAQKDAERRAADDIAERIRIDLGVFFAKATGVTK